MGAIAPWIAPGPAGWQQSEVDARWREIGAPAPAPLIPSSMIGWRIAGGRGIRQLSKAGEKTRHVTAAENDFWNYFVRVAADPYHKQGAASKVAGGVLQIAAVALPALSYAQAASAVANVGLAQGKQGADAALAARAMEPALVQEAALAQAKDDAVFTAQIQKLQSLAPGEAATALDTSPVVATAAKPKIPLPVMLAGGLLLLGAMLA